MRIHLAPSLLVLSLLAGGAWGTAKAKNDLLPKEAVAACLEAQPAPPEPGSLAARADLEAVLQAQAWRTQAQEDFARKMDAEDLFDASAVLGPWFAPARLPQCAQLFERVEAASGAASSKAKHQFTRLRPPYLDPRVAPCVKVPPRSSSSYPSGHATFFTLGSLVLAEIFPERREDLLAWGRKAAWSRIIAGVHFPTDVAGGRLLAESVFEKLKRNPEFLAALARCREEAASCRLEKAG